MARIDTLKEIYCKRRLIKDFNFDGLFHAPISYYLSQSDISRLRYLATSAKYSSKPKKEKFAEMDKVLEPKGFIRYHSGTNRIIYRYNYDNSFLLKIAIDTVGMSDNPDEYYNQRFVKPFVTKVFDVTPCGTVSMVERVNPISNRYEFEDIAGEIFDILNNFFLGKYVLEDIGTDFFMNWGIRDGFGPVLLDFPYLYEIDGGKLQCNAILPTGKRCDGLIDYDNGLNTLVCEKCGKRYTARSLGKDNNAKSIKSRIIEEETNMEREIKVSIINEGKEFKLFNESEYVAPQPRQGKKHTRSESDLVAYIVTDEDVKLPEQRKQPEPPKEPQQPSVVNPDVIKGIEDKLEDAKGASIETTVVVSSQTVASPDTGVSEQADCLPPRNEKGQFMPVEKKFTTGSKNSALIDQDDQVEQNFANAAKKEQEELAAREAKANASQNAKELVQINKFMERQMRSFPFTNYEDEGSTSNQRNDMIDYLVGCVSAKFTLDPETIVMIVSEYIGKEYTFNDDNNEVAKVEKDASDSAGNATYGKNADEF